MRRKTSTTFIMLSSICAIMLVYVLVTRPTTGQPFPDKADLPGRYQMAVASTKDVLNVVVMDSSSGQCWQLLANGEWRDWGAPLKPHKEKAEGEGGEEPGRRKGE